MRIRLPRRRDSVAAHGLAAINVGNGDYGALREEVMLTMRERARELACEGLSVGEIAARLGPGLTATESELLMRVTRSEVASAAAKTPMPPNQPPQDGGE